MMCVQFLELAQSELDDVFEACEYQRPNLGHEFIQETKETLQRIKIFPGAWPECAAGTRRCLLKSFPYAIIYHQVDSIIYVVALANLRKKPIHWVSKSVSEYSTCRISSLPETIYTR